jgi:hypothetical protein
MSAKVQRVLPEGDKSKAGAAISECGPCYGSTPESSCSPGKPLGHRVSGHPTSSQRW